MAIDDNTLYGLTGAQVKELPERIEAVKGLARELTTDDYNYPTDNPTGVGLWLLEPGIYTNAQGVMVYASTGSSSDTRKTFIVGNQTASGREIVELNYSSSNNQFVTFRHLNTAGTQTSTLSLRNPIDNLTSTSTSAALSANQGKVLKDLIDSISVPDTFTTNEWDALWA